MKLSISILAMLTVAAVVAPAAPIDGAWRGESKMRPRKGGGEMTVMTTLHLTADGSMLKGTVSMDPGRKRMRSLEIKDGKLEGERLSFTTLVPTKKKGDVSIRWEGTIKGDEMELRPSGGGKRFAGSSLVLKRQG